MIAEIENPTIQSQGSTANTKFLSMLPLIRQQALSAFGSVQPELKEELVAEVIANSFAAFTRLVQRGKGHLAFATPLTQYAVRQVRAGQRGGGTPSSRDLLSVQGMARHELMREPMHRWNRATGEWRELLV